MAKEGKSSPKGEREKYNKSVESLTAIWQVLAHYASPENPLTTGEIAGYLQKIADEQGPSLATVERMLPKRNQVLETIYPHLAVCEKGTTSVKTTYIEKNNLHVVLENAQGNPFWEGEMTAQFSIDPVALLNRDGVGRLLMSMEEVNPFLFPFHLECVRSLGKQANGKVAYEPYCNWEGNPKNDQRRNNQPRRYYLGSKLSAQEWKILSDVVAVYPYVSQGQTAKIQGVLQSLCPGLQVENRFAFKQDSALFAHMAVLDKAIAQKRQVRIDYGEYVLDKESGAWEPVLKRRVKNGRFTFDPYALMWSNGYYYLVGRQKGRMNLRLDRIVNVVMLEERFVIDADFDFATYRDKTPVMYPGQQQFVKFRCQETFLNTVIDFFGKQAKFSTPRKGEVEVTMSVATGGVKLFALQYATQVEVLAPESLREEIYQQLQGAMAKYAPIEE